VAPGSFSSARASLFHSTARRTALQERRRRIRTRSASGVAGRLRPWDIGGFQHGATHFVVWREQGGIGIVALEYGEAFGFLVWIYRCGILAAPVSSGARIRGSSPTGSTHGCVWAPLTYTGFKGSGYQVRDVLYPADLVPLLVKQMRGSDATKPRVCNSAADRGRHFIASAVRMVR